MFAKALVFALVASVTVQGFAPYRVEDQTYPSYEVYNLNDLKDYGSFFDKAKGLLNKLKDIVTNGVQSGAHELANIVDSLEGQARDIISHFTGDMDTQTDDLLNELARIQQEANDMGVDASECFEGKEDEIKNLPHEKKTRIVDCCNERITEAKNIVTGTVHELEQTWNAFKDLSSEFGDCGSGFLSVICYTKIIGKLTLQVVRTPIRLQSLVRRGVSLVTNFRSKLALCALMPKTDHSHEATELIHEVETCVHEKSEHKVHFLDLVYGRYN